MCWEYIISLAIGVLSSLIATAIINKKSKKEKFNDEKQIFQRYIGNLRLELSIHTKNDNIDAIQRILENEPVLKTFNELSKMILR